MRTLGHRFRHYSRHYFGRYPAIADIRRSGVVRATDHFPEARRMASLLDLRLAALVARQGAGFSAGITACLARLPTERHAIALRSPIRH
jgi:hypothetical protein